MTIIITIAHHRSLSRASRIQFTPPANLPMIHSDPILPSMPSSSDRSLSFGLPQQNFVHFFHSMCATCPGDEYKLRSNFLHSPIMFPLRYTEKQYIQIKWSQIRTHNSTLNAL
jgi:hypothetical protein